LFIDNVPALAGQFPKYDKDNTSVFDLRDNIQYVFWTADTFDAAKKEQK
jgi:hypothetical protein